MAVQAVIARRRMFPQERPAFLSVAGVTGFVDGVLDELCRRSGAVRVVAVGARHFSGLDRMGRDSHDLSALRFVTVEAHLHLSQLVHDPLLRRVNVVAVGARYVPSLMRAALPMQTPLVLGVAAQAQAVLHIRWRPVFRIDREDDVRFFPARRLHMRFACAVASLAAWRAWVGFITVLGLVVSQYRFCGPVLVVAGGADGVLFERRLCCRGRLASHGAGGESAAENECTLC